MSIDSIKELLDGFDPASLLPDLDKLLAGMEPVLRVAVMVGPLCLLGLGLLYLLASPKEANHMLGFRCWWGMSSVEAWQFTQRLAGMVWTGLGLVLTIVMAVVCSGFKELEQDAMMLRAAKAIGWELGLVVASIVAINGALMALFDSKGYRRRRSRM